MLLTHVRSSLRIAAAGVVLAVMGCRPAVREDRTITFSADGRASFQHGPDGVFVADPVTGQPKRIYHLTGDDLATSPPAWDSAGKRMVFAVARPADGAKYTQAGETPAHG